MNIVKWIKIMLNHDGLGVLGTLKHDMCDFYQSGVYLVREYNDRSVPDGPCDRCILSWRAEFMIGQ